MTTHRLEDAEAYCLALTKQSGSSFYHSFRFLPKEQRLAMTALYAFCREVDDVVDETPQESVARKELDLWRQRIKSLYQGNTEHPVTIALSRSLEHFNMQESHMQELIDGMEMDLDQNRYPTFKELQLYCYRAASVVGLLSAEVFGYTNRQTLKYAHDLGLAFQLTNILRDVKEDMQRNRIYIPEEELERFNVPVSHLKMNTTSLEARALFQFQAERAQSYYQKAAEQLPNEDRFAQKTGLIMSAIYSRILQHIQQSGFQVLEGNTRIGTLTKIKIAWLAARAENKREQQRLKHSI